MKQISATKAFDCDVLRFEHKSDALKGLTAKFSIILPPKREGQRAGLLLWLSGLTCTDENFIIKAGAAPHAKKYNVAIACPDTSPRGANAPGEDDSWDFGTGAGCYVDATTEGFENYQMETYVINEFLKLVTSYFSERVKAEPIAVFGHSMGGMGALKSAYRHPQLFKSVSAFAPATNPVNVPWCQKCFSGYLGDDRGEWAKHDPTELVRRHGPRYENILIEQGTADDIITKEHGPQQFVDVCDSVGQKVSRYTSIIFTHSVLVLVLVSSFQLTSHFVLCETQCVLILGGIEYG